MGQNPTEAEVKKCCNQLRQGQFMNSICEHFLNRFNRNCLGIDDRIGFDVFLPIMQTVSKNRCTDTAEDFIEGLRHFDKDGSGYISSAELRHLLTTLGRHI